MTGYQVAIPSHARADKLNGWALRALADAGVPPDNIGVFVTEDERDAYAAALDPGLYASLELGALGLHRQRAAIEDFYGDGARLIQCDDDVRGIVKRANARQLEPCPDLLAEATEAFTICSAVGARLWGVYPVANAGWMKARINTGLLFCWGSLFGQVVDTSIRTELQQKEDYERTLRYWSADGVVIRVEWLSVRTRLYSPGGLDSDDLPDRVKANETEVAYLRTHWPDNVRINRGRVGARGQTEIRLTQAIR